MALGGAFEEVSIRLPGLRVDQGDFRVQLGACNVGVALALTSLARDAATLRRRYPKESVNAQP
ncbi:hypothetical protein AV521_00885 [Streptomyces sp. IMTB 2501]|nr:hypothetical protein AV521_00885 [Streptomyces sp. IMTB 2501]